MEIRIGNLTISPTSRPLFIAELGINHNGDMATAFTMIDEAKLAGAQIVKFQHHLPEEEMILGHPLWDVLERTKLNIEQLAMLKEYSELRGLLFLCTPFCIEAADQLESIGVEAFKLGSGELNNLPLQEYVARKKKPTIISTGMSSLEEVKDTLGWVTLINRQIILMNCASTYPATPREARLNRIAMLNMIWPDGLVGQSDHTPTISTCLGAIAKKAVLIEKHMTLDNRMKGPDHKASITPDKFKLMVEMGNEIWEGKQAQGLELAEVLDGEKKVREWANHSLMPRHNMKAGQVLTKECLTIKRPGTGIPAKEINKVVGMRLIKDVKGNRPMQWEDLDLHF